MSRCAQELCPNWSGDGDVCPCALFDLKPPRPDYTTDDGECCASGSCEVCAPHRHDWGW